MERKRIGAYCIWQFWYPNLIMKVLLVTFSYVCHIDCISQNVLPWRLLLKLSTNIIFVLIGRLLPFLTRECMCLWEWYTVYISQAFPLHFYILEAIKTGQYVEKAWEQGVIFCSGLIFTRWSALTKITTRLFVLCMFIQVFSGFRETVSLWKFIWCCISLISCHLK